MTDETHFDNDYDEACHRILSAATATLLLHSDRLPDAAVKALQAIVLDAKFLYQFGKDAGRMYDEFLGDGS